MLPLYLQTHRYPLLRLLSYLRSYRKETFWGVVFSVLSKFFDIFPEILIWAAVDLVVNQHHSYLTWLIGNQNIFLQLVLLGVATFFHLGAESLFQFYIASSGVISPKRWNTIYG